MATIRDFQPSDAAAVSDVVRRTMRMSNVGDYPLDHLLPLMDYFSPDKIARLAMERVCLVAEVNHDIVATAALDGTELVTFFVLPADQGSGIGTELLVALEDIALAQGHGRLIVHASLTGAAFYERRGYHMTGVRRAGAAGEQIQLAKVLNVARVERSDRDPAPNTC